MNENSSFEVQITQTVSDVIAQNSTSVSKKDWDDVMKRARVVVPLKRESSGFSKRSKYLSVAASVAIVVVLATLFTGTLGEDKTEGVQTTTDKNKVEDLKKDSENKKSEDQDSLPNLTTTTAASSPKSLAAPVPNQTQATLPVFQSSFLVNSVCGVSSSSSSYTFGSGAKFTATYNEATDEISLTKHSQVFQVDRESPNDPIALQIANADIGEKVTYPAEGEAIMIVFESSADPSGLIYFAVGKSQTNRLAVAPRNQDGYFNTFVGHSWRSPQSGSIVLTTHDYTGMRYYASDSITGNLNPLNTSSIPSSPSNWLNLGYGFSGLDQVIQSMVSGSGYRVIAGFDNRNVGCTMSADFR